MLQYTHDIVPCPKEKKNKIEKNPRPRALKVNYLWFPMNFNELIQVKKFWQVSILVCLIYVGKISFLQDSVLLYSFPISYDFLNLSHHCM